MGGLHPSRKRHKEERTSGICLGDLPKMRQEFCASVSFQDSPVQNRWQSMNYFHDTSKPYVRWWWIQGPYREPDIVFQLDWVKANGFGGVELAWIYPLW